MLFKKYNIYESTSRAVEFLVNSRSDDKLWYDFSLMPGESNAWVSGYVGYVLSDSGNKQLTEVARETWNVLGWRRLSGYGGWGYNINSFEDADSTLWCLRLANRLGVGDKIRAKLAEESLARHINPDGGITTYAEEIFTTESNLLDVSGWCQTHGDVTAAAACLPQFNDELCKYLVSNQDSNGAWRAYWFVDEVYSTALATEALSFNGDPAYEANCDKALSWIITMFGNNSFISTNKCQNGSPFATALGARIIFFNDIEGRGEAIFQSTLKWLLDNQNEDGSWQSSAFMRVPPMSLKDPAMHDYIDWEEGMVMDTGVITRD